MRTGVALGSNVGDRLQNLRKAREQILALEGIRGPCLSSAIYETAPVGCEPGAASFFNAVIEIDCCLRPLELLAELKTIEMNLGRPQRHPRNSPRTIDLDVLYVGDHQTRAPALTVPHPRLHLRPFVLRPLVDVRPDLVLPGQTDSVEILLRNLPHDGIVCVADIW